MAPSLAPSLPPASLHVLHTCLAGALRLLVVNGGGGSLGGRVAEGLVSANSVDGLAQVELLRQELGAAQEGKEKAGPTRMRLARCCCWVDPPMVGL